MSGPVRVDVPVTTESPRTGDAHGTTGSSRVTEALAAEFPALVGSSGATGSSRITDVLVAGSPAAADAFGTVGSPAAAGGAEAEGSPGFTGVSGTSCACDGAEPVTPSEPRPQAVSPMSIGRPSTTPCPDRSPVRERWHLFAPDSSSVPRARHMTRDCLEGWGLHEHVQVAELLVSELVTNALRHSGGAIRLALFFTNGMLRGEVEDADPSLPRVCQARDEDERGRGMYLLELLSCCWGSARTGTGKTVWFELTAQPARG
ncbi:ATP-binding protein [Streptosporangium sp. NPDC023615]|uniref:ATP-binding protein n=1 Tax=Streptosporangium sp. NPDC023615 TaxID=3154794 RepID=UPI003426FE66